ncbi:Signal transduction histidine kinase [Rhodovulum sp. ES.010]|uniref:ATP-binding protein n=1 Tax=Rhodovulum sp. ES.010 TaxID=1882821 RepID=UPI00092BED39|nr:ATP-binding protein [Rhodovulum sp. ES.010]SIO32145.1 Signal transduction histidine kinase [Rhodovulum sp. ES.010]
MKPRLPIDGLAARFSILLAAALIAANAIAAALLYADRARQDSAARFEREVERIVSLVPAIEAAPAERRIRAARAASTRLTRVSVDPVPRVAAGPTGRRAAALTRALQDALGDREVRAALVVRHHKDGPHGGEAVALSIRLDGDANGLQWLNTVSRGDHRGPPGIPSGVLLLVLGVSLVSVLGVALVLIRRLTRPLNALADAARAAGQGDRRVRVPEAGPRELRDAAAAFNEMQARIARFDAERMRTLAAVGHDLRTPITSLRIRAELLDEEDAAPMIQTLDEMTVMADGLVHYARGAGDGEEPVQVDLAAFLVRLCEERGAILTAAEAVHVQARPVALGRAFGNIIDNAIRYGGAARVRLERARDAVQVTVEDGGPGIPEERLSDVLEPFVRGEESRSGETGGAGLGLSIARNIIASHGGEIRLDNRPEGGLRVTISLPAAKMT